MSLLNVTLALLAYQDGPATQTPNIRLADLKWAFQGLSTDQVRQVPIRLAPGETMTIASTARTVTFNGSTSFAVTQVNGKMRITCSIGQRTARPSGDSTTQWTLTVTGEVCRLTAIGGTSPDFTQIIAGDTVTLDVPFQAPNQGDFVILSKGSNYVDFVNPYAIAENQTGQVQFCSSGPVQTGDTLDLTGNAAFSFPNRGAFPITRVTAQFIEVLNPNVYTETVSGVTGNLSIYPFTYQWLLAAVGGRVLVGLNGDTPSGIEIEPPAKCDLTKNPGLFLKRGKVFQVQVSNPELTQVEGFLLLAE